MLGLVLEGGASRTLFSCGVMDAMLEIGLMTDYIIGTSAGISYGVSYASMQKGRNLQIMREYMGDKRYMGVRHLLDRKNKSYYNLDFVYDEIPNKLIPFDYKAYKRFSGKSLAAVTNVVSGKPEYFQVRAEDKQFVTLRASCALPFLFPPIEIDGQYYLDGGISDSIPFEKAFADGCDKVIIVLTRERGYVKTEEKIIKLAGSKYKKYPEIVKLLKNRHLRYNQTVAKLPELEKQGKVLVIAPVSTFGIGRTEKNPQKLQQIYDEGYNYVIAHKDEILEFSSKIPNRENKLV